MNRDYDHIKDYIAEGIDSDVRNLIADFAILWNNYENYLFSKDYKFEKLYKDNKGNELVIDTIFKNMNNYAENEVLELYDGFFNYYNAKSRDTFRKEYSIRYSDISDDDLNILMKSKDLKSKYLLLLLVTGRVRNNMFHGIKIISQLNDQKELFEICNRLLTLTLDITNTLVF